MLQAGLIFFFFFFLHSGANQFTARHLNACFITCSLLLVTKATVINKYNKVCLPSNECKGTELTVSFTCAALLNLV